VSGLLGGRELRVKVSARRLPGVSALS
jgi:hypothetical protein